MRYEGTKPEGDGVSGHRLLPHTSGNEEALKAGTILLHTGQIFPQSFDRAKQEFILIASNKVIERWNGDVIKTGSSTEGFWVLATKSGRKEKVQDFQLRECHT